MRYITILVWLCVLVSFRPVAAQGTSYHLEQTQAAFETHDVNERAQGRTLVDIEVRYDAPEHYFSGLWAPIAGVFGPPPVHTLIHGDATAWASFQSTVAGLDGRWLDVEITDDVDKRWSAVFLEEFGPDIHGAVFEGTEAAFEAELALRANVGYSLTDFDVYMSGGTPRYVGVFHRGPAVPRTHLYRELTKDEIDTLVNPLQGRIIDLEEYDSAVQTGLRYAVVVAQYGGGPWGLDTYLADSFAIDAYDGITSAAYMTDLELTAWVPGEVHYMGVWGDSWKSMNEVAALAAEIDPVAPGPVLDDLFDGFETDPGETGVIGAFAKNLRTEQSLGYREDEFFYLASVTKWAVHAHLWSRIATGELDRSNDFIAYTDAVDTGAPWYMDERPNPGFASGGMTTSGASYANDLGMSFDLDQFDAAMMTQSDNAATSALVRSTIPSLTGPRIGGAWASPNLNEWLADVSGVGQGWGVVTSIEEIDRLVLWNGQQGASFQPGDSYFEIPSHTARPRLFAPYRACTVNSGTVLDDCVGPTPCTRCGTDDHCNPTIPNCTAAGTCVEQCVDMDDPWGDLRAHFGLGPNPTFPSSDTAFGEDRYFGMGLNSATPRALGHLMENYREQAYFSEPFATQARANLGATDTLATLFPCPRPDGSGGCDLPIRADSKGGLRGATGSNSLVVADTSIVRMGTESLVMVVLTEGGSRSQSDVQDNFSEPIGLAMLERLTPNLYAEPGALLGLSPTALRIGEELSIELRVSNEGGGNAAPFEVSYFLSDDVLASTPNIPLETRPFPGFPGYASASSVEHLIVPEGTTPGDYYLGWTIDPWTSNADWGTVPEYDETDNQYVDGTIITVLPNFPVLGVDERELYVSTWAGADTPAPLTSSPTALAPFDDSLQQDAADTCDGGSGPGPITADGSASQMSTLDPYSVAASGSAQSAIVNDGQCGTAGADTWSDVHVEVTTDRTYFVSLTSTLEASHVSLWLEDIEQKYFEILDGTHRYGEFLTAGDYNLFSKAESYDGSGPSSFDVALSFVDPDLAAGRVEDLRIAKGEFGKLLFSWHSWCPAPRADYAIYDGGLRYYSTLSPVLCSTAGETTNVEINPPSGSRFYLVVPQQGEVEGSFGELSFGVERQPTNNTCKSAYDPTPICEIDGDSDGVPDMFDNCLGLANPSQDDIDDDGIGDACDTDRDNDGVPNASDNCPDDPNPAQEDADIDGIGDVCDFPDADADGVPDLSDNCPNTPNPGQEDSDGDGIGDACDFSKLVFIGDPGYGDVGGLAEADQKCMNAAARGDLTGTFKAWISGTDSSGTSYIHARDRMSGAGGPFVNMDGDVIAPDWNTFLGEWPVGTHLQEEYGNDYVGYVWTGTTTDGMNGWSQSSPTTPPPRQNCDNWTTRSTSSNVASIGRFPTQSGQDWTQWSAFGCPNYVPFICVEQ